MLGEWEQRMKSIGHGASSPMTPIEALTIAKTMQPQSAALR